MTTAEDSLDFKSFGCVSVKKRFGIETTQNATWAEFLHYVLSSACLLNPCIDPFSSKINFNPDSINTWIYHRIAIQNLEQMNVIVLNHSDKWPAKQRKKGVKRKKGGAQAQCSLLSRAKREKQNQIPWSSFVTHIASTVVFWATEWLYVSEPFKSSRLVEMR